MRSKLLSLLACASILLAALPAHAQTDDEPVGQVTLRWTITALGKGVHANIWNNHGDSGGSESATDQLRLVYQGQWTWKVTRDDAVVEELEMDQGQGRYSATGSGGGSDEANDWTSRTSCVTRSGRGYWTKLTHITSSAWSYEVGEGHAGRPGVSLARQGTEMIWVVDWPTLWEVWSIGGSGTTTSSSSGCSLSTETSAIPAGGDALAACLNAVNQASSAWNLQSVPGRPETFRGKVQPRDWGFSVSKQVTYNAEPISQSDNGENSHSEQGLEGSATAEFTLTYQREPPKLEAVITVPGGEDAYAKWQPQAGRDEDQVGNQLRVEVTLRDKEKPDEAPAEKATFRFRLLDASREPGVCLNSPPKEQAKSTPDLKIDPDVNPDLEVTGDDAASTKTLATAGGVTLSCYDWGAYARFEATATTEDGRILVAHLDGQPDKEQLTIPLDDNGNHIADAWEENEGVLGKNYPANWDGSPIPRNQKSDGDGISLYEKYRGFEFGIGDNVRHERLAALAKHVFIYDPDGIVLQTMVDSRSAGSSVPKVSQCRVRFVDDGQWSGAGEAGSKKRIVNFNSGYGHAVDQHALDVVLDSSASPTIPPDWQRLYTLTAGHAYTDTLTGTGGITWPDYSFARPLESPGGSLRISVFIANIDESIVNTVRYHTTAADVESDAQQYIREHMDQWEERRIKRTADVISHEVGHGLGIDHHSPTASGDKTCVMRYFSRADCPRNASDRFELACRNPWPNKYCTSDANCWAQVQVSDK